MTSAAVVMPSLASYLRVAGGARGGEMAGEVMRGVYLLTLLCDHGLSAKRGAVVCPCLVCADAAARQGGFCVLPSCPYPLYSASLPAGRRGIKTALRALPAARGQSC